MFRNRHNSADSANDDCNALLIGCGYLGKVLLPRLIDHANVVCVSSRSSGQTESIALAGAQPLPFDINKPRSWRRFKQLAKGAFNLYCLVPPSLIDFVAFTAFIETVKSLPLQRAILTSSSVVYGMGERDVDADSEIMIDTARAQRQYAIEQAWMELGDAARIVRMVGLYGPGRIIGQNIIKRGDMVPVDPDSWLNLIHVEDAARLLLCVTESEDAATIELGCDGTPVRRGEYYHALAKHFGYPAPVFTSDQSIRGGNRRCFNDITRKRTKWRPLYPDYIRGWSSA